MAASCKFEYYLPSHSQMFVHDDGTMMERCMEYNSTPDVGHTKSAPRFHVIEHDLESVRQIGFDTHRTNQSIMHRQPTREINIRNL